MARKKYNQWDEWERIISGSKMRIVIGCVMLAVMVIAAAILFYTQIIFEDIVAFGAAGFIILLIAMVLIVMGIHDWNMGVKALRDREYRIQRKKKKRN